MAKQKITANGELDLLTATELEHVLRSWRTELTRGVKLRRHAIMGTIDAGGLLEMGENHDGPAEGMAWAVTRFSVGSALAVPAGGIQVYVNAVNPSSLLVRNLTGDVYPGDHGCNLQSGDSLRIAGSGLPVSTQIVVTMSIKEVPIQQIWSL